MTRSMIPAPRDTALVKTSHGTWVALLERWGKNGALLELAPLRPSPREPITQEGERRDMLMLLQSKLLAREDLAAGERTPEAHPSHGCEEDSPEGSAE